MTKQQPFTIKVFVTTGDPDGIRILERSNWTGLGLVFNRADFKQVQTRDEVNNAGVYILVGDTEDSSLPQVYVGEGDPVKPRLQSHFAKLVFWDWGVFFVTKDTSLNKAHVRYLESRLIELAGHAKRCTLTNAQRTKKPSLSSPEEADVESFLSDMLNILPLIGLDIFDTGPKEYSEREVLQLKAKGITAAGFDSANGFLVQAGSGVVTNSVPSIHSWLDTIRRDLLANGVIVEQDGAMRFASEYLFKSPSAAAGTILGRAANGRIEWKDAAGTTLKELQQQAVGEHK
jgi:hypothetical protein